MEAEAGGADYVAIGAVFPTSSKGVTRAANIDRIRDVRAAVRIPVVAIGGITVDRVEEVLAAGASSVAVISDLLTGGDPAGRVRAFLERRV